MPYPNIFSAEVTDALIRRIEALTPATKALWGKMTVSQMLAHTCVTYEMTYETKHPKPNALMRFFLKAVVKSTVTGEKPYKRNLATAPAFLIKDERDFNTEKQRLIAYLRRTQQLGAQHFDGKESLSFGRLTIDEWNTMFYKHLDHHLQQFGA